MNPIIEGLTILAKYYPDEEFSAAHDQVWYAPYDEDKITPEDFHRLQVLNWFENHDSWSHLC